MLLSVTKLMRGNMLLNDRVNMTRVFVEDDLAEGIELQFNKSQSHYLATVLRLNLGESIFIFNGRDGGFRGVIDSIVKRSVTIRCHQKLLEQSYAPDLWFLFVPIKRTRLDFLTQKATELGAAKIWPVQSEFGQVTRVKEERLRANIIEAAEQTERLDLPDVGAFIALRDVLSDWNPSRILIVCDEAKADQAQPHFNTELQQKNTKKAAILIGPEGGFSAEERAFFNKQPYVVLVSLGPRILRSDTAAIAALSLFQAYCGDWYNHPHEA